MNRTALSALTNHSYLNLETFRKNGQGVPTPVWFAADPETGIVYVRTIAGSGKVKRIRNHSRARIAPCNARGTLLGPWVEANAYLAADEITEQHANQLLSRKYGLQKRIFEGLSKLRKNQWATIKIIPAGTAGDAS